MGEIQVTEGWIKKEGGVEEGEKKREGGQIRGEIKRQKVTETEKGPGHLRNGLQ